MKTKAYIIDLKYGIWENQLWLKAENSPEYEELWERAKSELGTVAEKCRNSGEFFAKAIEHFRSYGFIRIQK